MTLLETLGPFLLCAALLWPLGEMRKWLYQHLFKVGWLLTKNLQTATVLFYTFFLPGVLLHEFVRWLAAGILNVRAERAISWPETQQIAELKLNFVKLARSTSAFSIAVIEGAPFLVSLVTIWLVAHNTLQVAAITSPVQVRGIRGLDDALSQLLSVPDVFLWLYLLFAIGNTMLPRWSALRGARILLIIPAVAFAVLVILGVADEAVRNGLFLPLGQAFNLVSGVFLTVIGVNVLMTAALGIIESTIERITGDSATFEKGKLIARTRAEVQALRRQEAERLARERAAARQRAQTPAVAGGPPSIYRIALPTPNPPGREPVPAGESVVVRRDESRGLPAGAPERAPLAPPGKEGLPDASAPASVTGAPTAPAVQTSAAPRPPSIIPPGGVRPAGAQPQTVPPRASERPTPPEDDDEMEDKRENEDEEEDEDRLL
jgi:hypothetical protein